MGVQLLLGFGYALFSTPNTNAIMSSVDRRSYGLASGAVGTMRLLGMIISMGIATVILTLYVGRVSLTVDTFPGFIRSLRAAAFILFSFLCFLGIFASPARGPVRGGITASKSGRWHFDFLLGSTRCASEKGVLPVEHKSEEPGKFGRKN